MMSRNAIQMSNLDGSLDLGTCGLSIACSYSALAAAACSCLHIEATKLHAHTKLHGSRLKWCLGICQWCLFRYQGCVGGQYHSLALPPESARTHKNLHTQAQNKNETQIPPSYSNMVPRNALAKSVWPAGSPFMLPAPHICTESGSWKDHICTRR